MKPSPNQFYNQIYSPYWTSKRPLSYENTEYDDFLISLVPPSVSSVLEACCGNGIPFSRSLAQNGYKVSGFDISQSLVSQFNESPLTVNGFIDDIHTFNTLDPYGCLFIYHSIHLVPRPYDAILSLISNCPNIPYFIIEFPSIYSSSNSSIFYSLELLHSKRFNFLKVKRFLKNFLKSLFRMGFIDRSIQNLYEPLSLFRLIDTVNLPYKVFGVILKSFSATEIPLPVCAERILQYDRLVVIFTR